MAHHSDYVLDATALRQVKGSRETVAVQVLYAAVLKVRDCLGLVCPQHQHASPKAEIMLFCSQQKHQNTEHGLL